MVSHPYRRRRELTMSDEDLCYVTATEALRRFEDKSLSPLELLNAQIARSEKTEPVVNALTDRYFDEARVQTQNAAKRYANDEARPLEGLPVAIKDESSIRGKITTNGSVFAKDAVATTTSICNRRLMRAGALVHMRTATPEFSCSGVCWSLLHGVTRNPWNPDYTPGGSSGGSSAALASGITTLASGSDIGGSVRIPASCAGVVGFKPTYGRIPEDPPFNLDTYSHQGPLARSVADAGLMFNVLCGPHEADIVSLRPRIRVPIENPEGIKGLKIATSMDLGFYEVDPEVRKNTETALQVFRDLGATVEEVDVGWTADAISTAMNHLNHIFGVFIETYYDRHAYAMTSYARAFAESARNHSARAFFASLEGAADMYTTFGPIMKEHDIFVCPTLAAPAVPADWDQSCDRFEVNGKSLDPWFWLMTYPFNTLSRCPVLAVPSGRASNGVPTGIQIVGRTYDDIGVFKAGLAYESAVPLFDTAERRPTFQ